MKVYIKFIAESILTRYQFFSNLYMFTHIYTHICIHTYTSVCICACVCVLVCVCVCIQCDHNQNHKRDFNREGVVNWQTGSKIHMEMQRIWNT